MNSMLVSLSSLEEALRRRRYETARRIACSLLIHSENHTADTILGLHQALAALGDLRAAVDLLTQSTATLDPGKVFRLLAEDFRRLATLDHYRISDEASAGLTADEYKEKYLALAREQEAHAAAFPPLLTSPPAPPESGEPLRPASLRGRIVNSDGKALANVQITLGRTPKGPGHPPREIAGVEYLPCADIPVTRTALTDAEGRFAFEDVAPVQDFLAVTSEEWEIPTRFLLRDLTLRQDTDLGTLTVTDWQSAPAALSPAPHPPFLHGMRKLAEVSLHNPFDYDFPRQLLRLPLPDGADEIAPVVCIAPDISIPAQVVDGEINLQVGLPAHSRLWIAIYEGQACPEPSPLSLEKGARWTIETGTVAFRIAGDHPGAPIAQVRGHDGIWRGCGRFCLPHGTSIGSQSVRLLAHGPVLLRIAIDTVFSNGKSWNLIVTAVAGEPILLVREQSEAIPGASFEFSLREFSGGRGFLHWTPEHGNRHWDTLSAKDHTMACLPESVPWWIPPQGFAYAMGPDGLDETDYVAVFTIRRGEWMDHEFAKLAQGPVGEDGRPNHELDWPYPEMVGSSISWITARTAKDGDACFRFSLFDGERQWGLLASSLSQNDGDDKQLAALQHAYSSPRLQEWKDWHFDIPDTAPRPLLVTRRKDIPALRDKRLRPGFRKLWEKIRGGKIPGPARGLAFAVEGDPAIAWSRREELLASARVRTRMTLLGRDRGDLYSPVGGRPITQHAEDFDLLAASGVFSPSEERELRAYLILMAHMFMEPDLMNWRFNSRNANFEADRVEIIGTIGLAFPGHPDSEKFVAHALARTSSSLQAYCTPRSGKWYENPACYYLHASKCRMALLYHLASSGRLDLSDIPQLKEFLRWGLLLLTPPQPLSYETMRDGDGMAYEHSGKVRNVPPIGDHAALGAWLPEHYAFIGKLFSASDPDFGKELRDAWFLSSGDALVLRGIAGQVDEASPFGNLPLLFTALDERDMPGQPELSLESRRLEGFGAVFRAHAATPREVYVLIKQGPGGYRYHRTEGSFLFFADGRPLVYEGGEGGETWRHSTLSFYDTHMPLAAGKVEHCLIDPQFHFIQAAHPTVIRPGEPVFLSDNCDHHLVAECHRRYRETSPAVSRAFALVGGRYLLVQDELFIEGSIPWQWNLQVVAEGESGSLSDGFRFQGRHGMDLNVQFPGQHNASVSINRQPILEHRRSAADSFALRHLQLSHPKAASCIAVLLPAQSGVPLAMRTRLLERDGGAIGVQVEEGNRIDRLWCLRRGCAWDGDGIHFEGTYGAHLQHERETSLVLAGRGRLTTAALELHSDGPGAVLHQAPAGVFLRSYGHGNVTVVHRGKRIDSPTAGSCCMKIN